MTRYPSLVNSSHLLITPALFLIGINSGAPKIYVLPPLNEAPEYLFSLLNGRATLTPVDNSKSNSCFNALAVAFLSLVAHKTLEIA